VPGIAVTTLRGLALPAKKGVGGYFAVRGYYDVCWGDLLLACFCPVGGRAMARNFGSQVQAALYDPLDTTTFGNLEAAIRETAASFVPHVRILSVQVSKGGPSQVQIRISFTPAGEVNAETRTLNIDRTSTLRVISGKSR
jgi:phage baseplate assembly protein W